METSCHRQGKQECLKVINESPQFSYFFLSLIVCVCVVSCSVMSDSVTLWTLARQAILSMGFFRQEYLNGLPFPPPGDLPDPRIKPVSPALLVDSLPTESLVLEYGNKAEMIQNV